jgi:ligand-binding sensor domain-containing protein
VDRLDSLWVGTSLGLVKWEPRFQQFLSVVLPADAGLQINAIAADAANGTWIGTSLGLVHLAPDGAAEFYNTENSGLIGNAVQAIAVDDTNGDIWIVTSSGISQINGPPPAADPITDIFAYPNPVEIKDGAEARVRFNAPPGSRVMIYTAAGRQVAETSATAGWDLRSASGRIVASGVYLYVIRGPQGEFGRGKFAVINRR